MNQMKESTMAQFDTASVYFDGLCPLCSREIDHYRKLAGAELIRFVDITRDDFQPEVEGVNPQQVHKVLHMRTRDGDLQTGIDAFIEIWKLLHRYQWAAKWAQYGGIRILLKMGYSMFAQLRPYLPRRSRECEASPYCELKK
jgi:predicted DCC family thiol-disulfide oxidoreductase YuxK